jgi:LysM repeat protein
MYELSLRLDCPGMPRLLRHYVLMLDLPGMPSIAPPAVTREPEQPQSTSSAAPPRTAHSTVPTARRVGSARLSAKKDPIQPGTSYRVSEGDTLSTIAERVAGRPSGSIWTVADAIFASNGDAFIRGNPDLIKLGSVISIPSSVDGASISSAAGPNVAVAPADLEADRAAEAVQVTVPPQELPVVETREPVESDVTSPVIAVDEDLEPFAPVQTPAAATVIKPAGQSQSSEPMADRAAAAVVSVATRARPREISPLLAVAVGVVMGLALSVLMLRGRLLNLLLSPFARRRTQAQANALPHEPTFGETDELYQAARVTKAAPPGTGSSPEQIAVQHTQVQDYIVETTESARDEWTPADDAKPDAAAMPDELAPEPEQVTKVDQLPEIEQDLADIFAEDLTSDQDGSSTATGHTLYEQTEAVPLSATETDDHAGPDHEDTVLAAVEQSSPDATATKEFDLQALAETAHEDEKLSETLMEALTLLERDYEHELTASQMIDREQLDKALRDKEVDEEADEDSKTETIDRKMMG